MGQAIRPSKQRASFPVSRLEYDLPRALIAQQPAAQRDGGRMLVLGRESGELVDARVLDLPDRLSAGDLLVVNDTRVLPARFAVRRASGGRMSGLFLEEIEPGDWLVMLQGAGKVRLGETLYSEHANGSFTFELARRLHGGRCRVMVLPQEPAHSVLEAIGITPLPPYIRRPPPHAPGPADLLDDDRRRYQTVFARRPGAVAAPTAGLHLSEPLLERLRTDGIEIAKVTLHVGPGTFEPIRVDNLREHRMHTERYELSEAAADAVRRCKQAGGHVIAVGTTSLRVLESCVGKDGEASAGAGETALFCYPPFDFRVVDGLMTNFHLPRSTLLALVMAFGGEQNVRNAYEHAVSVEYRFFSFGDAMLIV